MLPSSKVLLEKKETIRIAFFFLYILFGYAFSLDKIKWVLFVAFAYPSAK